MLMIRFHVIASGSCFCLIVVVIICVLRIIFNRKSKEKDNCAFLFLCAVGLCCDYNS